ncbi:hypothetical protein ACJZ2D_003810 [Fusarium nematophilum]
MPRQGDGSSDNAIEATHDIAHGVGKPEVNSNVASRTNSMMANVALQSDRVARADKTAPLPEGKDEHGKGLQDVPSSGGQSQGIKEGKDVGQGN